MESINFIIFIPINYNYVRITYSEDNYISDTWDNAFRLINDSYPEFLKDSAFYIQRRIPFIINILNKQVSELKTPTDRLPTVYIKNENKTKVPIDNFWKHTIDKFNR